MKTKLTTAILLILLIILLLGIILLGGAMYFDLVGIEVDKIYPINSIAVEEPKEEKQKDMQTTDQGLGELIQANQNNIKETSNIIDNNGEINRFFYNQLTGNQTIIYNKLQENKENLKQGNYKIEFKDTFSDTLSKENGGQELGDDYQTAIEAFMNDNPDVFYIDVNKMYLNIETTTKLFSKTYKVYISPMNNSNYLSEEFSEISQIETALIEIEKVRDNVLKNLNGTEYQKIEYIHNYLIDNIEYDSTFKELGTYSLYGALVRKKCVCEGYAKAFKYLVNQAGIECEFMQGTATNNAGETESHAWNCVKLRRCLVFS